MHLRKFCGNFSKSTSESTSEPPEKEALVSSILYSAHAFIAFAMFAIIYRICDSCDILSHLRFAILNFLFFPL